MAKKDLSAAAAKGADLFFTQNSQNTQDTQPAQVTDQPHRAQDEQPAQLAQTVQEMQQAIIDKEQRKAELAAAKKANKKRLNLEISLASYDYVSIMAGITGVSVNKFISDIIDREAATNNQTYLAAKEIIANARKQ